MTMWWYADVMTEGDDDGDDDDDDDEWYDETIVWLHDDVATWWLDIVTTRWYNDMIIWPVLVWGFDDEMVKMQQRHDMLMWGYDGMVTC